jgi:hypothetical protein
MTELDDLLRDPRSHRAVAEPSMSSRVAAKALGRFQAEAAQAAPAPVATGSAARPASQVEVRAMLKRWLPSPRRAALQATGVVLAMGAALGIDALMLAGYLPRLDILAKYWLEDLADAFGQGLAASPLMMAAFLASATCLLGFALSARARHTWRETFGR